MPIIRAPTDSAPRPTPSAAPSWKTAAPSPIIRRTAADAGAQGGNVGALDGSVVWKTMKQMRTNQASSYLFYYGNW
jgi:hypothetical protein